MSTLLEENKQEDIDFEDEFLHMSCSVCYPLGSDYIIFLCGKLRTEETLTNEQMSQDEEICGECEFVSRSHVYTHIPPVSRIFQ